LRDRITKPYRIIASAQRTTLLLGKINAHLAPLLNRSEDIDKSQALTTKLAADSSEAPVRGVGCVATRITTSYSGHTTIPSRPREPPRVEFWRTDNSKPEGSAMARLEHANLCVRDIEGMLRFLRTAFPDFRVRADRTDGDGSRWVHFGNDDSYLAMTAADAGTERDWEPYSGVPGVNHLGFEVDDAEALRARMLAAGYEESTVPNAHPFRKRVYFLDPEGNDWEFVEYLSAAPDKRHDYAIA
jgi:catechol 2,3-dioxygenase-like lactoylglutathione lyase family enzyme